MGEQLVGTILTFPKGEDGERKGYGYLTGEDEVDRFFHRVDCIPKSCFDELQRGDSVNFEHAYGTPPAPAGRAW